MQQQMTVVCAWCGAVKYHAGTDAHVSHGICSICSVIFGLQIFPALMAPRAERPDCYYCDQVMNDSDGVPEGCRSMVCVRRDRRSPWGRI